MYESSTLRFKKKEKLGMTHYMSSLFIEMILFDKLFRFISER